MQNLSAPNWKIETNAIQKRAVTEYTSGQTNKNNSSMI